ncbi:MAG: tRNA (cytidine(34)-2'-O)-methyltransferase [Acholeplasmataceae bacterium]|jgi:tRNA (cytidine/uridine-2'-O-)-methyltransferase
MKNSLDLNIVLYEPEIPQNTGNIMRTCVATNATLHLIRPLGFSLDEKYLKRSGLDYIKDLNYFIYDNFSEFIKSNHGHYYFLTRYGHKNYKEIDFTLDEGKIYLIFGKESTGVDRHILKENLDKCYRIPTTDKVRSLNLSNAVAIVTYEVLSQYGFPNLFQEEPETLKGANFLDDYL